MLPYDIFGVFVNGYGDLLGGVSGFRTGVCVGGVIGFCVDGGVTGFSTGICVGDVTGLSTGVATGIFVGDVIGI